MDTLAALRRATGPLHDRIEALPVCQEMAKGRIDRETYLRLIRGMHRAALIFEEGLAGEPRVREKWPDVAGRARLLAGDIRALGGEPSEEPSAFLRGWRDELLELAEGNPLAWAGVGYVFEGSRMGSRVLLRPLAEALDVEPSPGNGLDYHLAAVSDKGAWPTVRSALTTLAESEGDVEAIVDGARASFEMMIGLHQEAEVPVVA